MLASVSFITSFVVAPLPAPTCSCPWRAGPIAALESQTPLPAAPAIVEPAGWQRTEGGLRYRKLADGTGALPQPNEVVSLHYTISFSESGQILGTTRGQLPFMFALGKHNVPIFDDAVRGLRVGSSVRVVVPASQVPRVQTRNVPKDQDGEALMVELEVLSIETGLTALIPSLIPPGERRTTIARTLFALSFVPYLLPDDIKPDMWKWGDVNAIQQAHDAASNSLWLGGAATSLDTLFQ